MLGTLCLLLILTTVQSQVTPEPKEKEPYWPVNGNLSFYIIGVITEDEYPFELSLMNETAIYDYNYFSDASDYFGPELWNLLLSQLQFSFKIIFPKGSKNSLSAVTQMVANGDAHVSFVPTVFVPEETKGVVISQPTHSTKYKLFIQSPTSVSTSLSLGKVFTPVLWLAIIISMIMMGVILIFIEFVGQKARIRSYLATPADIGQLIIIVVGCFCYQGAIQIASGCSGRVVVWTSLICGYLIYISYNTLVISQLTTVSFKPPFETLQDMAAKGTHKLIVRNQTALLDDIKITRIKDGKRGILADIWDQLLPMKPKSENLYNEKKSIGRLCQESIAMLDSELEINAAAQKKYNCNVISLKDSYFRSNLGFVLNKNNTFNKVAIRLFNRMRETGIINRMRRFIDQPDVGPLQPLPTLNPIQLDTLMPMLVLLFLGMLMSVLCLGLEILIDRKGVVILQKLEERGIHSWRDVVLFWKKKKPEEDEESSSEEDDSDVEQPSTTPIVKISNTPESPIKIKNEVEKGSKRPVKAIDIKTAEKILGSQERVPQPYSKTPVKAPAIDVTIKRPERFTPRALRRQDRVADLTTLLPKPLTATLTPVYLDKNIIRDHDSSQGSNTDSNHSNRSEPEGKLTPEVKSKQSSGGSNNLEVPVSKVPRSGRSEIVVVSPKPSPRYDPQVLLRPKPSPRGEEVRGLGTPVPVPPPREELRYVNVQEPVRPPRGEAKSSRVPEEPKVRRRSNPTPPALDITPPSLRGSPKKERQHDWQPMYYNEQDLQRPTKRSKPKKEKSAERERAPPLYRNLQLSMDSDGFLDRHSILDRNLARRMRDNREPDPFADLD